jgi:hypothetical protein
MASYCDQYLKFVFLTGISKFSKVMSDDLAPLDRITHMVNHFLRALWIADPDGHVSHECLRSGKKPLSAGVRLLESALSNGGSSNKVAGCDDGGLDYTADLAQNDDDKR